MRHVRAVLLAGLALKALVLCTWWWSAPRPAHASAGATKGAGAPARSAPSTESRAAAPAAAAVPADLLERSRGFRDLLEAVRERGGELDRREQALAARETALKALEKVLADEIARLEGLSGAPAAAGAAAPAEAPGGAVRGVAITKIYESMRAEEAAPIIGRLDDPTAHRIFARMKEKQIAAILAAMAPERAVELTRGLAGRDPAAQ